MGNFIKVTELQDNGTPEKEKTWINSDKITKIVRFLGRTIVTIDGTTISVEETPEDIIKKINWSEAKRENIVMTLLHNWAFPTQEISMKEPPADIGEDPFGDTVSHDWYGQHVQHVRALGKEPIDDTL